jgi:hypothetical protein
MGSPIYSRNNRMTDMVCIGNCREDQFIICRGKTMEKLRSEVKWIADYDTGLKRAEQENKPMLLDFFKEG